MGVGVEGARGWLWWGKQGTSSGTWGTVHRCPRQQCGHEALGVCVCGGGGGVGSKARRAPHLVGPPPHADHVPGPLGVQRVATVHPLPRPIIPLGCLLAVPGEEGTPCTWGTSEGGLKVRQNARDVAGQEAAPAQQVRSQLGQVQPAGVDGGRRGTWRIHTHTHAHIKQSASGHTACALFRGPSQ